MGVRQERRSPPGTLATETGVVVLKILIGPDIEPRMLLMKILTQRAREDTVEGTLTRIVPKDVIKEVAMWRKLVQRVEITIEIMERPAKNLRTHLLILEGVAS